MALPDHLRNLSTTLDEVSRLEEIHEEISGTSPGRRHNMQVINKPDPSS